MKILIAGAGKVGRTIARELGNENHDITMIDTTDKVLEFVQTQFDIIAYSGNAASMEALAEADIASMDVFIAATNYDEVNLLSCLTAHTMNPKVRTIARIRDPQYVEQAYAMASTFGLDLVINPEKQAAQEIATLLKYPGFLKRETFAKARVQIVEAKVKEGSKIDNVALKDVRNILKCQVLIIAVIRGSEAFAPSGNFILKAGDRLFVTGVPEQLELMLKNSGMITKQVKHVVVGGGSRIAYYLAQELNRSHISTTIIEQDPKICETLATLLPATTIINGDISSQSVLDNEEIDEYDAYVSVTGMDELNIVSSLYASTMGVPNIVTKLGRGTDQKLTDSLSIGSIVCPKDLITMHIVRYVRAMTDSKGAALTIHKIADGRAEVIEFIVEEDTKHIGEALKDLKFKDNILIAAIGRGNATMIPNGDSSFKLGDTVIVGAAESDSIIYSLNDIFED